MKYLLWPIVVVALALGNSSTARAQSEITLIAPFGIKAPLDELFPGFERETGHKVNPTYGSGLGSKRRVAQGDIFDVPIVQPPYPEVLASGHVVSDTATPLATVAVGVAVRKGAPKPGAVSFRVGPGAREMTRPRAVVAKQAEPALLPLASSAIT